MKVLKKYSFSIILLITCIVICPFLFKETFFKEDTVPTTDFSLPSFFTSSVSSSVNSSDISSDISSESSSEISSEVSSESSSDDTVTSEESSDYEESVSSEEETTSSEEPVYSEDEPTSSEEPVYSEDPIVSDDPSSSEVPVVSDIVNDPVSSDATNTPSSDVPVDSSKIDYPALIIGDSRTVGVQLYGYVPDAYYFADVGLSSYGLFYSTLNVGGEYLTLEQALAKYNFKNIFIGLGLNEMGGHIPTVATEYAYNVQRIRELAPNSIIHVQAILHVSPGRNASDSTFNNARINEYNSYIASMANGVDILYLDANPYFDDENGNMTDSYTSDGIHFYAVGYVEWGNFMANAMH